MSRVMNGIEDFASTDLIFINSENVGIRGRFTARKIFSSMILTGWDGEGMFHLCVST